MKKEFFRSPLFYVGDKYKLLPQLTKYFPKKIDRFIEPFVGGGSVFLNTNAKSYLLNDFDKKLIGLHKYLYFVKDNHNNLFKNIAQIIDKYNLSKSYQKNIISTSLKKKYPKTYYAQFNKKNYTRLKDDFNKNKNTNYIILYILLIFGFNRILRFNSKGEFNLPVGNVDFNKIKGNKGFMIISKENRIEILPAKKSPNMENPYWLKEDFEDSIKKKYKKSLLYVKADTKGSKKDEEFHFNEAYLLEGFDFEKFTMNLKKGILKIDIRLGLYDDGRNHDHGTGVRIKPAMLEECFIGKRVL